MRVNVDGRNIEYELIHREHIEEGRPLIIFLHEGLGSIGQWKDFPERLCVAARLPGLVYERPGYGRSDAPDYEHGPEMYRREALRVLPGLRNALGLTGPYFLFGHSDGATIALVHASLQPPLLSGAIILCPHVMMEERTIRGVKAALELFESREMMSRLDKYHPRGGRGIVERWSSFILNPASARWTMYEELKRIHSPLLLVQCAGDEYGSFAQLEAISARSGGPVEELRLTGCGHHPHLEQPGRVIEASLHFMVRHS